MSSESKKRNPDISFLFLSKVPVNGSPPPTPTGPLWREVSVYRAFFYITLKFLIKYSLNIEIFSPSLKGPGIEAAHHIPQKRGPYGNRRPFPEP
jgi:hypothetical protein